MPKWLDYIEDQAKSAVKAVTPNVVEHAASAVVNNPVAQAVGGPIAGTVIPAMFGPAAPVVRNVAQATGVLPGSNPLTPVTSPVTNFVQQVGPSQYAQQAWQQGSLAPLLGIPQGIGALTGQTGQYLAGVPQRAQNYFTGDFKDNIATAAVNLRNANGVMPRIGAGAKMLEAWFDPSFQIANNPVRDVHTWQGGGAYYVATHGGQMPSGQAVLPFNGAVDWAREHPEEWPNIQKVYEQGYDPDGDGVPDYTGDRAVWEYYIGQQDRSVRILSDVFNDPWNATLMIGFLESTLGKAASKTASVSPRGAKAIEAFAKSVGYGDRAIQELMGLPLKPVELPLKGAASLIGRTEAGQAIGRGAGAVVDFLHLGETAGSKANRAANEATGVVGRVGDQTVTKQQLPTWATPLDGTGKYEAVLADRDSGASYIVDPQGNPVPGSALDGKNANKTNRKTAETWNTSGGGRPGVQTNPTTGFSPVVGEQGIVDNGTTPFPEGMPTPATNPVPEAVPPGVPAATVGQSIDGITPAIYQQTPGQRRAAVNEGMSVIAPNVGDTRLTSEVERLRATDPESANAFYYTIGLDPATGRATSGTPAGNLMDTLNAISSRYYDDAEGGLLRKVADEKLAALRFTVTEEAPLFAATMGTEMRPRLGSIGQSGVDELILDLQGRKPDRGVAGLLETIVLSPSEQDAARATQALYDTKQPWLSDAVNEAQNLRTQANRLPVGGAKTVQQGPRLIAESDLPPLPPDHVRLVHLTTPNNAESIVQNGLNYRNQGMIDSTASAYSNQADVELWSKDPRYSHPGIVAVVMDVPFDEYRVHRNVTSAPGVIPPEQIVGVVGQNVPPQAAQTLPTQANRLPVEQIAQAVTPPGAPPSALTPALPADDPRRVPMDFWQAVKTPIGRRPGETLEQRTARVNQVARDRNAVGATPFDAMLDAEAIAANKFQPVAPTYDRLGISPLDAEGTTPALDVPATADEVMGTTPLPEASVDQGVPAETAAAQGVSAEPDPAVTSLLDELHQRGVVDDVDRDYLNKVYPGMERPLLEEILTRQRQGLSTRQIQQDIHSAIYRSGRKPAEAKQAVAKATGAIADVRQQTQQAILDGDPDLIERIAQGASTFSKNARQSQQYNLLNMVPGSIGDIFGNAMHFQQTGDIKGLGRFLSPNNLFLMFGGDTKVASRFTPEADAILAGFNQAIPEHIMPKAGDGALTRFGHNDQELVLWGKAKARAAKKGKDVPTWQKAGLHAIQSPIAVSRRTGIDLSSRGVAYTTSLDNQLDAQVAGFAEQLTAAGLPAEQTIDAIRRRATAERAPKSFLTSNPNGVLRSFEPEDVRAITGSEDLVRKWRSRQNEMYRQAAKDTNTKFFTDAKRYGVDDALSKVFFYHFWQTRALALQARSMLRNPRVMGQYYRMIQGAMNEADQKGYPSTFRGLLHYMGDESGFYGLFNPLGVLVPAMMFGDLAQQTGQGKLDRLSSILPINPIITGAAAALGLTDDIPNLFGTARVQNMVAGIVNYGAAHGIDFTRGGMYRDPVQYWTGRAFELINDKAGKAISQKRYQPYDPQTGKLDTIRSIIYHQMETEYGPSTAWTPEQWTELQDAMDSLDVGGAGNDRADAAFTAYSDANMRNLLMGSILPQGSVLRYGPRETARNDAKDNPTGTMDERATQDNAQLQRDIVTASPETRAILVGQQQLDQLGTERQRSLYNDYYAIVYGVDDKTGTELNQYVQVGGQQVTVRQLQAMTEDQRKLIATAFVQERGGAQELSEYRDMRSEAIAANPALADYGEYKSTVGGYENGGTRGFRTWAAKVSDEFARRQQERRDYLQSKGISGDALEADLDDWAFSTDAYTAFTGAKGTIYDARPASGADVSNDPMAALAAAQGGGSGYGSSSGGNTLAARLDRAIASYQQRLAEYQAAGGPTTQMPGMWGQAQEQRYGQMPQPSEELARYILWTQRQPQGADTSTQAYEAWVTAHTPQLSPTLAGQ